MKFPKFLEKYLGRELTAGEMLIVDMLEEDAKLKVSKDVRSLYILWNKITNQAGE